jgi:predicted Zn-dependent protease
MWIAWARKNRRAAFLKLKELVEARPDNPVYRSRLALLADELRDPQADALYQEAIAQACDALEPRAAYSQFLIDHRRCDDAIGLIQALRSAEPRGAMWPVLWFNVHRIQDREGEAVDALRQAVQDSPKDGLAWALLGQAQQTADDDGGAVESLERAMKLLPHMNELRILLPYSLNRIGKADRAEEMLRDWVRREPEHPTAHMMLAQQLARRGSGHLAEALREAESALALPTRAGGPPPQRIKALAEGIRAELRRTAASQPTSRATTRLAPTSQPASKPSKEFRL